MSLRDDALREAVRIWPGVNPDDLKFWCDDCKEVDTCEFAYDLYNAYTIDGKVINTGCLAMK